MKVLHKRWPIIKKQRVEKGSKGEEYDVRSGYNRIDSNGTITYTGSSEITKGNRNNMPQRTEAYLPTDERGHIQASSLGESNKMENVVAQSAELNHGVYYSMEKGERTWLFSYMIHRGTGIASKIIERDIVVCISSGCI